MTLPLGVAACLLALGALLGGVRVAQVRLKLHPEVARKLMHVGVGLIALSFPWVFTEKVGAWIVCGVAALVMVLLKFARPLRRALGDAVHGVERASLGDLYFLGSVPALFTVAPGAVYYAVPILVLTFADALAALIGVAYGRRRFAGADGPKSVEGSVAFFAVAFLAAHVPLLLFTDTGRLESLLVALLVGFLVMLLEAVAWEGIDNLFIPFGTFIILRGNLDEGPPRLLAMLGVALLITAAFFVLRRRTGLRGGALVGAAFVCFMCWSMAGWSWLVAPITLFAAASVLWTRGQLRELGVAELLGLVAPALVWLLLAVYRVRPEFFYPFTLAFAALWAVLWAGAWLHRRPESGVGVLARVTLASALLFLGPYVFLAGADGPSLARAAHGLLTLALVVLIVGVLARGGRLRLQTQAHLAGLAGLAGFAAVFF